MNPPARLTEEESVAAPLALQQLFLSTAVPAPLLTAIPARLARLIEAAGSEKKNWHESRRYLSRLTLEYYALTCTYCKLTPLDLARELGASFPRRRRCCCGSTCSSCTCTSSWCLMKFSRRQRWRSSATPYQWLQLFRGAQ